MALYLSRLIQSQKPTPLGGWDRAIRMESPSQPLTASSMIRMNAHKSTSSLARETTPLGFRDRAIGVQRPSQMLAAIFVIRVNAYKTMSWFAREGLMNVTPHLFHLIWSPQTTPLGFRDRAIGVQRPSQMLAAIFVIR
ncbi:MAG: hypothetical protein Q9224_006882, partial [Gallowayella concinna]